MFCRFAHHSIVTFAVVVRADTFIASPPFDNPPRETVPELEDARRLQSHFAVDPPNRDIRNGPFLPSATPPRATPMLAGPAMHRNVWRPGSLCTRHHRVQDEILHRLGKAFVAIGIGNGRSLCLDFVGDVAHRDAKTRFREHKHVVLLIPDGSNLLGRHPDMRR